MVRYTCSCGDSLEFATIEKARKFVYNERYSMLCHGIDLSKHQVSFEEVKEKDDEIQQNSA